MVDKLFLVQNADGEYLCRQDEYVDYGEYGVVPYTDYFFGSDSDVHSFAVFASEADARQAITELEVVPKDSRVCIFGKCGQ